MTAVVITKEELDNFSNEILGKGEVYNGQPSVIYSGELRGVVGNFRYVPSLSSVVVSDDVCKQLGIKPKKVKKQPNKV